MDEHHKILFSYVNEFHDAASKNASENELKEILDKIVDYTSFHFQEEEILMEKVNFPGLKSHKRMHDLLLEEVLNLKNELERDEKEDDIIPRIVYFLKGWLTSHVGFVDNKYSSYL